MKRIRSRMRSHARWSLPASAVMTARQRMFLLNQKRLRILPYAGFLKRSDFLGTDTLPPRPVAQGRGRSHCTCQLFFTNLPTATVGSLLAPGLTLAPNLSAYPDVHPVVQLVCRQSDTSWILNGVAQGVGPEYEEMILLVPFVRKGADPRLHIFVVRMYLTDQVAVHLGNVYYGYAKKHAAVEIPPGDALVTHGGNTALIGAFQKTGPDVACDGAGVPPNYAEMRTILALPVLGLLTAPPLPPSYVRSYFDWNDAAATVAPMTCEFRYFGAFTPGMPARTLAHVIDGAFWLTNIEWTIEWPGQPA